MASVGADRGDPPHWKASMCFVPTLSSPRPGVDKAGEDSDGVTPAGARSPACSPTPLMSSASSSSSRVSSAMTWSSAASEWPKNGSSDAFLAGDERMEPWRWLDAGL